MINLKDAWEYYKITVYGGSHHIWWVPQSWVRVHGGELGIIFLNDRHLKTGMFNITIETELIYNNTFKDKQIKIYFFRKEVY